MFAFLRAALSFSLYPYPSHPKPLPLSFAQTNSFTSAKAVRYVLTDHSVFTEDYFNKWRGGVTIPSPGMSPEQPLPRKGLHDLPLMVGKLAPNLRGGAPNMSPGGGGGGVVPSLPITGTNLRHPPSNVERLRTWCSKKNQKLRRMFGRFRENLPTTLLEPSAKANRNSRKGLERRNYSCPLQVLLRTGIILYANLREDERNPSADGLGTIQHRLFRQEQHFAP